jgi:hypothetical protein
MILKYRTSIGPNDLSNGDSIVVIGSPDASSSNINADFIRVIPVVSGSSTPNNQ